MHVILKTALLSIIFFITGKICPSVDFYPGLKLFLGSKLSKFAD